MGAWNSGIWGGDTAEDLKKEYTAAFYRFDVQTALEKIDAYVRETMCDESDEEEWANYYYSLADFMWQKGILTESVRDRAVQMIDSGFGLEIWAESGEKALAKREKILAAFREKLLSPLPAKKKVKPTGYLHRIFEDGDIIAMRLQTAGKPYTALEKARTGSLTEEQFHALDGKYILLQLLRCSSGWSSAIVPEVKDYWADFLLFDGIYDELPTTVNAAALRPAMLYTGKRTGAFSSCFRCESSMVYFKRRDARVIGNQRCNTEEPEGARGARDPYLVFLGINKPWYNPDSDFVAAMDREIRCGAYTGPWRRLEEICSSAIRHENWKQYLPKEENEAECSRLENAAFQKLKRLTEQGGSIFSLRIGRRQIALSAVLNGRIEFLCVEGGFQRSGFGTQLLGFTLESSGAGTVLEFPEKEMAIVRICEKLRLKAETPEEERKLRFVYEETQQSK